MSLGFTDGVCFWVMYFKAWSPLSTILIPIAWEAFVMSLFFDSTYCVLKSSPPGILLPLLGWSWGAVLELITVVEPKTPGVISLSSNDTPHYLQNWSSAVLFPPSCALFFYPKFLYQSPSRGRVRATGGISSHPAKGHNPLAQVKSHKWDTSSIAAVNISIRLGFTDGVCFWGMHFKARRPYPPF